jgi:hypothetical protein
MRSLQGIEMVYCISILENFSRSILASVISAPQDTEALRALAGGLGRVVRDHSQRPACTPQETQKPSGGDATAIAS